MKSFPIVKKINLSPKYQIKFMFKNQLFALKYTLKHSLIKNKLISTFIFNKWIILKCILVQKVGFFLKYKSGRFHGHKMKIKLNVFTLKDLFKNWERLQFFFQ